MTATIDEFQRHLQAMLLDLDHIIDPEERESTFQRLEITLQEVLRFRAALALRDEVGSALFEVIDRELMEENDRAEPINRDNGSESRCQKCEAEIDEDIGFCASCGEMI